MKPPARHGKTMTSNEIKAALETARANAALVEYDGIDEEGAADNLVMECDDRRFSDEQTDLALETFRALVRAL
jgi:hypothetical protein